jgi:hypothetical protein
LTAVSKFRYTIEIDLDAKQIAEMKGMGMFKFNENALEHEVTEVE